VQGSQGVPGERGDLGPEGARGVQGVQGLPGERGSRGERGTRGLAGTLLLAEGDQILQRTVKNSSKRSYTSVNEQNVTLQTRSVVNKRQRTDQLHFFEGPHLVNKTQQRISVRRSVHVEVYAPTFFQRVKNVSRVTRPIFVFANW
jgi:hypothetical protein